MKFSAILFDLDGTLIRTTHLYEEACIKAMHAVGLPATSEEFSRLYPLGNSTECWIKEAGGDPSLLDTVRTIRDRNYHELLRTRSEFLPEALALLDGLSTTPTAAVTNSWRSYLDSIHECIGLYDHVSDIVTADDTKPFYKPHPHGLLLAADRLGIDPKQCAYVGDQPFDLHAAKAAGMHACLIHGQHTPKEIEKEADTVLESLGDLLKFV